MPVHHHLRRRHHLSTVTAFTYLIFFSVSATSTLSELSNYGLQERGENETEDEALGQFNEVLPRKRVGGPGSSPPTCRSKCGKCSPCKAVHVPVQPSLILPLEYYPEAWRCKCGKKLFFP